MPREKPTACGSTRTETRFDHGEQGQQWGWRGAGSQEPPVLREWRSCDVRDGEQCPYNRKPRNENTEDGEV